MPLPVHPNRVMAQAVRTGLSTTVFIQGAIKTQQTQHLYESSLSTWRAASKMWLLSVKAGRPEFHRFTEAERNIRKNTLQMLYERAAGYGNRETTRIKSWDDTVGPMNQRLNIAGAALREFAMTTYPFPIPEDVSSEGVPISGRTGTAIGYRVSSFGPAVGLIHKTLPELEFVDAVRTHLQLLATHCYVHDVPLNDTMRYCNLFLLRARPYLDYIYSEHRYGLPGFRASTLKVLKELENEISKTYAVRKGDTPTVTSELEVKPPRLNVGFFAKQIAEARSAGIDEMVLGELERILKGGSITEVDDEGGSMPCLTDDDVAHIWDSVARRARRRGSRVHRHISHQFPGFWSMERAIRAGDEVHGTDEYVLCSEIPVDTSAGKGRADLVLLRREAAPTGLRILWRPVMVIDIKTKSAYTWQLCHERRRSLSREKHRLPQRVVPDFSFRFRSLDDTEWAAVVAATPTPSSIQQLLLYAEAISGTYRAVAESDELESVLKGTLLLDVMEDTTETRSMIRALVIKAFESTVQNSGKVPRTLFEPCLPEGKARLAAVVHSQDMAPKRQHTVIPRCWKPTSDPLEGALLNDRRFILYLSGESPTSSGRSAARIAMYYDALNLLHKLAEVCGAQQVIWLDLLDEFTQPLLAEARLRLRFRSRSDRDKRQCQPKHDAEFFFNRVKVCGLFAAVESYLFHKGSPPSISPHINTDRSGKRVVAVSGLDRLEASVPEYCRNRLTELVTNLLEQIPNDARTTVLWMGVPVPAEANSPVYSTRAYLPFFDNSPLVGHVTEIVWNLPVAPASEFNPAGWALPVHPEAPFRDEIRVLIAQNAIGFDIQLTVAPPLAGWSERFHAGRVKAVRVLDRDQHEPVVPDSETRDQMKTLALTLLPWLADLWPKARMRVQGRQVSARELLNKIGSRTGIRIKTVQFRYESSDISPSAESSLLDRLKMCPIGVKMGRSFAEYSIGRINSRRLYHRPNKLKTTPRRTLGGPNQIMDVQNEASVWFGQYIDCSDLEMSGVLVILDSPDSAGRMLVGFFAADSKPDAEGYVWSVHQPELLKNILESDFTRQARTAVKFARMNDGYASWILEPREKEWRPDSFFRFVAGRRGRVTMLRALMSIRDSIEDSATPPVDELPTEFSDRVFRTLTALKRRINTTMNGTVSLSLQEGGCIVSISDREGVEHKIRVHGTADLIDLLKWPFKSGQPIRLPSGACLYWSPFDDIDYGNIPLAGLLAETRITNEMAPHIVPLLSDVLDSTTREKVTLVLSHDERICPLAKGLADNHGKCWRIEPVKKVRGLNRLLAKPLSDREVYDILYPGTVFSNGARYDVELMFSDEYHSPEFLALRESPLILRLLRRSGYNVSPLYPGTYINARHQKWMVSFTVSDGSIDWGLVSTATGSYWGGRTYSLPFNSAAGISHIVKRFISVVTKAVPARDILELDVLTDKIRTELSIFLHRAEKLTHRNETWD